MDRTDLKYAYTAMPLEKRKNLSEYMGHSLQRQYQYFMHPASDKIGKQRKKMLLEYMNEINWLGWATKGRKMNSHQVIELKFSGVEPDEVIINGIHFTKN